MSESCCLLAQYSERVLWRLGCPPCLRQGGGLGAAQIKVARSGGLNAGVAARKSTSTNFTTFSLRHS